MEEDEHISEEGEEGWTKKAFSSAFEKQKCKCENEWRIDLKVEIRQKLRLTLLPSTTRLSTKTWKVEGRPEEISKDF